MDISLIAEQFKEKPEGEGKAGVIYIWELEKRIIKLRKKSHFYVQLSKLDLKIPTPNVDLTPFYVGYTGDSLIHRVDIYRGIVNGKVNYEKNAIINYGLKRDQPYPSGLSIDFMYQIKEILNMPFYTPYSDSIDMISKELEYGLILCSKGYTVYGPTLKEWGMLNPTTPEFIDDWAHKMKEKYNV